MASLVFVANPLAPAARQTFPLDERPIDWLQRHYPQGCGGAVQFFVNDTPRDLGDLDYVPKAGDVIRLEVWPAEPISLTSILVSIAISAALTGLSMLVGMLFQTTPKAPDFSRPDDQPSPVYSVRSNQNAARLAEPVPVPYGEVLMTPDICAQPYTFFANNTEEYLDMLLCLGQGDFDVHQVLCGDSDANAIADNAVQWHVQPPSAHQNQIGTLRDMFSAPGGFSGAYGFFENMVTNVEVGEQEFTTSGEEAGWFRMGKAGQLGRFFWVDIEYRQGLYQVDQNGNTVTTFVFNNFIVQECDDDGNPIAGTDVAFGFNQGTVNGRNPLRVTYFFDAGRTAKWVCRLARFTTQYPNGGEVNTFTWRGLRMLVDTGSLPQVAFYGNATLLAVRLRATSISSQATNQIKVKLSRKLPLLGDTGNVIATNSPADAFIDILTNTVYGARRPLSEVDVTRLTALRTYWAVTGGYWYGFNAVYTGATTVWEALVDTTQLVAAAPLPLGALMSVAQDGRKPVRTMLFTDQNIAKESFRLTYTFDREGEFDGVEIQYRNPDTFAPAYARYPTGSQNPDKVELFGCTDSRQAAEFARLMWQRRKFNRRAVTFDTEMEGLIPALGERTAVAHAIPKWGWSGKVIDVAGLTITADRDLPWDEVTTTPWMMAFRDERGGISNAVDVTQGPQPNIAILAADPWAGTSGDWALDLTQELTHFVFGGVNNLLRDFILTLLEPRDDKRVGVSGTVYDTRAFTGTFAFLDFPVP